MAKLSDCYGSNLYNLQNAVDSLSKFNLDRLKEEINILIDKEKSGSDFGDCKVYKYLPNPINDTLKDPNFLKLTNADKLSKLTGFYTECDRIDNENQKLNVKNAETYNKIYNFLVGLGVPTSKEVYIRNKKKFESAEWIGELRSYFTPPRPYYRSSLDQERSRIQSQINDEINKLDILKKDREKQAEKNKVFMRLAAVRHKYMIPLDIADTDLLGYLAAMDKNLLIWHLLYNIRKNYTISEFQSIEGINLIITHMNDVKSDIYPMLLKLTTDFNKEGVADIMNILKSRIDTVKYSDYQEIESNLNLVYNQVC